MEDNMSLRNAIFIWIQNKKEELKIARSKADLLETQIMCLEAAFDTNLNDLSHEELEMALGCLRDIYKYGAD